MKRKIILFTSLSVIVTALIGGISIWLFAWNQPYDGGTNTLLSFAPSLVLVAVGVGSGSAFVGASKRSVLLGASYAWIVGTVAAGIVHLVIQGQEAIPHPIVFLLLQVSLAITTGLLPALIERKRKPASFANPRES